MCLSPEWGGFKIVPRNGHKRMNWVCFAFPFPLFYCFSDHGFGYFLLQCISFQIVLLHITTNWMTKTRHLLFHSSGVCKSKIKVSASYSTVSDEETVPCLSPSSWCLLAFSIPWLVDLTLRSVSTVTCLLLSVLFVLVFFCLSSGCSQYIELKSVWSHLYPFLEYMCKDLISI